MGVYSAFNVTLSWVSSTIPRPKVWISHSTSAVLISGMVLLLTSLVQTCGRVGNGQRPSKLHASIHVIPVPRQGQTPLHPGRHHVDLFLHALRRDVDRPAVLALARKQEIRPPGESCGGRQLLRKGRRSENQGVQIRSIGCSSGGNTLNGSILFLATSAWNKLFLVSQAVRGSRLDHDSTWVTCRSSCHLIRYHQTTSVPLNNMYLHVPNING